MSTTNDRADWRDRSKHLTISTRATAANAERFGHVELPTGASRFMHWDRPSDHVDLGLGL